MPYQWYDTPNIHFCTFNDFDDFCRLNQANIVHKLAIENQACTTLANKYLPNLFGRIAIYCIEARV
jgi:methionine biosynthesis protein MetW